MKSSIKDFFNKCNKIRSFLRIWSYLQTQILNEKLHFFAVSKIFAKFSKVFNVSKIFSASFSTAILEFFLQQLFWSSIQDISTIVWHVLKYPVQNYLPPITRWIIRNLNITTAAVAKWIGTVLFSSEKCILMMTKDKLTNMTNRKWSNANKVSYLFCFNHTKYRIVLGKINLKTAGQRKGVVRKCSLKNVLLKISQNSQENSYVKVILLYPSMYP